MSDAAIAAAEREWKIAEERAEQRRKGKSKASPMKAPKPPPEPVVQSPKEEEVVVQSPKKEELVEPPKPVTPTPAPAPEPEPTTATDAEMEELKAMKEQIEADEKKARLKARLLSGHGAPKKLNRTASGCIIPEGWKPCPDVKDAMIRDTEGTYVPETVWEEPVDANGTAPEPAPKPAPEPAPVDNKDWVPCPNVPGAMIRSHRRESGDFDAAAVAAAVAKANEPATKAEMAELKAMKEQIEADEMKTSLEALDEDELITLILALRKRLAA